QLCASGFLAHIRSRGISFPTTGVTRGQKQCQRESTIGELAVQLDIENIVAATNDFADNSGRFGIAKPHRQTHIKTRDGNAVPAGAKTAFGHFELTVDRKICTLRLAIVAMLAIRSETDRAAMQRRT